jgi:hypothetical protein
MKYTLQQDHRLGVPRPVLFVDYEALCAEEQASFELLCQTVCAQIPEAIKRIELQYMERFTKLDQVEEDEFYTLMDEMNELSSCICDLNLLYLWIEGNFLSSSVHA